MVGGVQGRAVALVVLVLFCALAVTRAVLAIKGATPEQLVPIGDVQTYLGLLMAGIFGFNALPPGRGGGGSGRE